MGESQYILQEVSINNKDRNLVNTIIDQKSRPKIDFSSPLFVFNLLFGNHLLINTMRKLSVLCFWIACLSYIGCEPTNQPTTISSPSGNIQLDFLLANGETPAYQVTFNQAPIIKPSTLGFEFKDQAPLQGGMKVLGTETAEVNEDWTMPWGEQRTVTNHYQQLTVKLEEKASPQRRMNIHFRAFDDGIGFRYELLAQEGVDSVIITDEHTQFSLTGDHTCWWIPGDWDIYEHLYNTTSFTDIDATSKRDHPNLAQTYIPENAVNTPVTMRSTEGVHLSFHEADLTDYSDMTLKIDAENLRMTSELVGSERTGYKVKRALPFSTPWRTIQIGEKAGDLIESKLIVNLNEPNRLGDIPWFTPKKYIGIWWEMHLDKSTWDMASGRHGATTANTKRYIDFAAENNIGGVLVEGWNTGWENWLDPGNREGVFDFITPYSDYDLAYLAQYAQDKGVEIIMHHETSAAPRTYGQQLDTAYALMDRLGIRSVKTGYVGKIIPDGEYHHGQWMVRHYRKALETAATYNIAINAHEPIKATGIRRTLPNAISREGLRGQEFNAWSVEIGNPPEHLPIVAFTRMLAGPIDFTPGVFQIKLDRTTTLPDGKEVQNQINTTLAQQLALYVVIYSPIQMACDLPENYEGQPAFQFIRDVGVDWEQSIVLDGEVGDFVTIAREEKGTGDWFIGSITDENARDISISFDFIDDPYAEFEATMYKDGADAHWNDHPMSIDIEKTTVNRESTLEVSLAEGGGVAISLIKK